MTSATAYAYKPPFESVTSSASTSSRGGSDEMVATNGMPSARSSTAAAANAPGATGILMHARRSPDRRMWLQRLMSNVLHACRMPSRLLGSIRLILFLVLLGVIPASLIFVIDISVHSLQDLREEISIVRTGGGLIGGVVYLITGVGLCLLSTMYCYLWSVEAEGSGIPQMKCIMSGFYDKLKASLSIWTLAAKSLGLLCAIGGGLPVGWEGPNVHISCIIAHHLARIPYFRLLRKDKSLRLQLMVCACSVGLASSFGTPIGGVMYALETTGTFYLVPTYWKSYLATLTGAFLYDLLYKTPLVEAFENTKFGTQAYSVSQLLAFVVLGILMGGAGAFFVKCVHSMYLFRRRRLAATNRFVLVGIVAAVAAIIQYPVRLFRLDPRYAINEMFSADELTMLSWKDVVMLLLVKFPLVAVSIGLPIPAGLFIPCFLIGSCFGRLYGEILGVLFGHSILPGSYAVVGAAAFTAGVTRALSCAVIIFEVTGELSHMVPTLFAVLLAVIVGNYFNLAIYDTLVAMKNLPYMPQMRADCHPNMRARDVMEKDVVALPERCSLAELFEVMEQHRAFESFPVVNEAGIYLGVVKSTELEAILDNYSIPQNGSSKGIGQGRQVDGREEHGLTEASPTATESDAGTPANADQPSPYPWGQGPSRLVRSLIVKPSINQGHHDSDDDDEDDDDEQARDERDQARQLGQVQYFASPDAEEVQLIESVGQGNGGSRHGRTESWASDSVMLEESLGSDQLIALKPESSIHTVGSSAYLSRVHMMFVMLMPTHIFVTERGVLVGIIRRMSIVGGGTP
ncbi:Chloride channel protein F [Porphyridium purpureum]|uniref:Chloride channel protein n=1 Tax=Porphyridium purpureum TaxID=35688 RepID=A0A5J4Z475_PORPP|nr:Chloride channel protein F [Porphyridium purpureum]|eukprot:POR5641..scf295_1